MFIYAYALADIWREFPRYAKLRNCVAKCVTLTKLTYISYSPNQIYAKISLLT